MSLQLTEAPNAARWVKVVIVVTPALLLVLSVEYEHANHYQLFAHSINGISTLHWNIFDSIPSREIGIQNMVRY